MPAQNKTSPALAAMEGASSFELLAMAKRLNHDVSTASRALRELTRTVDAMRGILFNAARDAKQREREARRLVVCGAPGRDGGRCKKRVAVPGTRCERHRGTAVDAVCHPGAVAHGARE